VTRTSSKRRAVTSVSALLVIFSFVLGQAAYAAGPSLTMGKTTTPAAAPTAAAATLDEGGVSLDFVAAGPYTYNHTTGVGGAFDDRTISKSNGVVESLEGEDFACGDRVVFFTAITAEPDAGSGSIELDYTYDGNTTSGALVGFDDLLSATVNTGDSGNQNLDGNESVTVNSENFITTGDDRLETSIQVDGVDGGDQIILRMVVELYCDPNPGNVTGNIHSTLDAARVVGGAVINSGEQTVPLKQAGNILLPGLNVEKSCPPAATVGDTITYDITVSNTGQDTLTNLVVNDPLLGGNLAGFGTSLAAGASVTKSFQYQLGSNPDPLTNTVTATATGQSSNATVSDTADCTVDVLFPDLAIEKTADQGSVSAGDAIGYTITVTNEGDGVAEGVVMTDTLPTNAGLDWSFNQVSGGWSCDIDAGVLTCGGPNFDLNAGESASVHLSSPTTKATCGIVANSATVSASNNTEVETGVVEIVVQCASLSVAKVADDGEVDAGDDIGFTITVMNGGAGVARDVELTDTLPTNGGLDWEIDGGTGAADCEIAAGVLTCDFGDLASGESVTVHISSPTTAETCGVVRNSVSVTSSNDGNPTAGPAEIVVNCPNVSVDKTADQGTIIAGDTASFTIVVTNDGDATADDVELTDTLPGGVDWSEDSDDCEIAAGVLTCDFGDIAPGDDRTVTVWGETDATDCGEIVNVATVSASNEADDDEGDNASEATITVECPDVTVSKVADESPVSAGDEIGFTITVSNNGQGTAYGVTLTDQLPAGIDWSDDSDDCEIAAGVLTCDFGDLASGADVSVHISGTTDAEDCGVVENTATVSADNEAEEDTDDNTSGDSVVVDCPGIDIEKTADAEVVDAAELIGFTITVTNNGPGIARDVVVTDTLPTNAGLDWTIDDGTGAQMCSIDQGVLTCEFGDMGVGDSYTVHISSDTDATTCGLIDNTATVTISNGAGDEDDASITVECPELGIDIEKGGPDLAHVGDTVTYTFDVSLTTDEPLYDVVVTDPNCDAGDPEYVSGDDDDFVLEPGEVWTYTCDHLVTEEDADPLPNTATVSGTSDDGRTVTDEDDHLVDLIHPDIRIVKRVTPDNGNPGDVVTYTYAVTNTGDTTLYDVSVDDDVIGHIGDIAVIEPGETVTLTKDWELPADEVLVENIGTAAGTDVLGEQVIDDDDASVTIVEALNPPKPPKPTAFTGSDALRLGALAGLLLLAGLLAMVVGRRRRDTAA
jgi:uncharacterized repeat protein (TIGR01451 family)